MCNGPYHLLLKTFPIEADGSKSSFFRVWLNMSETNSFFWNIVKIFKSLESKNGIKCHKKECENFRNSDFSMKLEISKSNYTKYFCSLTQESIVGSVVECSPATRAARVRFPDDAVHFWLFFIFVLFPQYIIFFMCKISLRSQVSCICNVSTQGLFSQLVKAA